MKRGPPTEASVYCPPSVAAFFIWEVTNLKPIAPKARITTRVSAPTKVFSLGERKRERCFSYLRFRMDSDWLVVDPLRKIRTV